jgi:hypothetical protein
MEPGKKGFSIWEWAKAVCLVVLTVLVGLKIYSSSTTITVDFPNLLSLLIALFSVSLSALFYFKATDTSNNFYDNTYKFTKDIAELLVKIESGFGERLRHLDEGYSSMRNYLQGQTPKAAADVEKTKQRLETEELEIEKVRAERDKIVQQLIEQSQLKEAEKMSVADQLRLKEKELEQSQEEIARLNRKLAIDRVRRHRIRDDLATDSPMASFTFHNVILKMGIDMVIEAPTNYIREKFDSLVTDLPGRYIEDLEENGFFDGGLTVSGAKFFKSIAKRRQLEFKQ